MSKQELQETGRMDRLSVAVSRIRGRGGMDADRMLLIGGGILIVGGVALIVLGWYGAANTGLPFEQTPYLISGGMLGLALTFLGGFMYFGYWVTRLVRESRSQADRAAELLDQIYGSLNGNSANGNRPTGGRFVATRNGTQFHRPDCTVVAGRKDLRQVSAAARGMSACRICDPLGG